jgi:hypothetical protein
MNQIIKFVGWVDRVLNKSLSNQNIKSEFKVIRIWRFNLEAMDDKTELSNAYTTFHTSNEDNDNLKTFDDNQQWGAH